ncbi:PREDICTED: uncharacterized protein LOC106309297 [Brassica oleracea var. oleracea]|uniref:uncharacterized protein LOC106309297 n=1 Tax=Brassica oleracea var. oleracea TaxID=109376 RepID=UPI0006A718E8|nr:PREDICTED: uncharacterized protein LOC106309297 [Brassica oleracea var. oleracea]
MKNIEEQREKVDLGETLFPFFSLNCGYECKYLKEELKMKRKKQLKKDTASKIKSLVDEGKHEQIYEQSEEFQKELKLKISEEEGRLKKDEEEQKEIRKKKREHEEQWEGTRETGFVSSWRDFLKAGKKAKKGETRPPKLKTEDPNKSYVQRPVKKG